MNQELIEFFTSQEIIVVYIVAGLACILCLMIYFVEKNNLKARRRHNTKELNKLVKEVKEQTKEEEDEVYYDEPVLMESVDYVPETSSVEEMIQQTVEPEVEPVYVEPPVVLEEKKDDYSFLIPGDDVDTLEEVFEDIEPVIYEDKTPVVEKPEVELEYTSAEPDVLTAQKELQELTEVLQKQEEARKLENSKLTSYEESQEEDAIISLEELVQKSKSMYEANEITQYTDEGNEPISLQELETLSGGKEMNLYDEPFIIENVVSKEEVEAELAKPEVVPTQVEEEHRFKSSPFISPIFGIESEPMSENELALENTANYQKLDDEIKKTNEFLMTLKELQQKLDS